MARELPVPELALVALYIASGCAGVLKPLLDFLQHTHARSPVLDAAAAAVVLTVPVAYLAGIMLLYLHIAPAAALPPAAIGRFAILISALLIFMAFIFFLASAAGVR